ncbi:phosphodiester glycosidase family protein [Streptomyces sp. NPDC006335]|uniref:phosphodiester glycosidase family protein n=1 Tax=Streptomyces sp. NPDC006335 TaxID=3156895 RepID=UPI00339F2A2A
MNPATHSAGRSGMRRVAAVSVALATLALTQSAAVADPATNDIHSVLDSLSAHHPPMADGIERTTYSSDSSEIVVRVAVIDPDLGAISLDSTVGAGVSVKEPTTAMLATVGTTAKDAPYVGVNGGYSVSTKDEDDATGKSIPEERSVPMVTSVQEDVVQGAACLKGQNSVVLQHGRPHFTKITTTLGITSDQNTADTADDATRVVDAVNRYPGWIPFCPQEVGDRPLPFTTDANGEVKRLDQYGNVIKGGPYYQDYSEIVAFTPAYGQKTPEPRHTPFVAADDADGVEVAVDASGRVTAVKSPRGGMAIPAGGMVLQGIGDDAQSGGGAQWLRDHAMVGAKLTYTQRATDLGVVEDPTDDVDLPLDPAYPSIDVVNGTHDLMRNGKVVAEPADNVANDPRTAIGADGWGRTLLVTVTAKDQGLRRGVPIYDLAKIMEDLGAVDALNLDGGGSTTFVVDGQVKNVLSDPGGVERPVYDAVYAGRGGHGLPAGGN